MLSIAIKQAFTGDLFTNHENMQYLNTVPDPPQRSFETTKLFWLVDNKKDVGCKFKTSFGPNCSISKSCHLSDQKCSICMVQNHCRCSVWPSASFYQRSIHKSWEYAVLEHSPWPSTEVIWDNKAFLARRHSSLSISVLWIISKVDSEGLQYHQWSSCWSRFRVAARLPDQAAAAPSPRHCQPEWPQHGQSRSESESGSAAAAAGSESGTGRVIWSLRDRRPRGKLCSLWLWHSGCHGDVTGKFRNETSLGR